jgi:hypothetical protein
LGDLLDQPRLLHLVRDFRHHDLPGAVLALLHRPSGTHTKAAASGLVGGQNCCGILDQNAARREIRSRHVTQQIRCRGLGIPDQVDRRGTHLAGIVRRYRRRHADGNARRAIGEQIGKRAGQHDRLALLAVIGRTEIDRVLVDAGEQRARNLGQPRLGVAHRRGVIAVDVAEIALALDQRIARREILREPHQRIVHRDIAVRMELADHVTDDAGAFLEPRGGIKP